MATLGADNRVGFHFQCRSIVRRFLYVQIGEAMDPSVKARALSPSSGLQRQESGRICVPSGHHWLDVPTLASGLQDVSPSVAFPFVSLPAGSPELSGHPSSPGLSWMLLRSGLLQKLPLPRVPISPALPTPQAFIFSLQNFSPLELMCVINI